MTTFHSILKMDLYDFFEKQMLFSVLIQRYTRNKSLLFFGCESVFWALYRLYPKKILFFIRKKSFWSLYPKKGFFSLKMKLFRGLYSVILEKKSFFLKFQKTVLAYTPLYSKKNPFFRPNKSFFFLARPLNPAMKCWQNSIDCEVWKLGTVKSLN